MKRLLILVCLVLALAKPLVFAQEITLAAQADSLSHITIELSSSPFSQSFNGFKDNQTALELFKTRRDTYLSPREID